MADVTSMDKHMKDQEEELYTSDAWKNATPHQRREFISKVRANKRNEKEAAKKAEMEKELKSKPAQAKRKTRAQIKAASALKRAIRESKGKSSKPLINRPSLVKVYGIDVTSTEFLSTYQWRKLRMEALIKYGRKCMCCGATPETGAVMNVDHIKPRKLFPSLALDINNLQILCHPCNHGKGNWDQSDWRKK